MTILKDDVNNITDFIKKYKFEVSEELMKLFYKVIGYPMNNKYWNKFKENGTFYIDPINMSDLFEKVIKKYSFYTEINKPVGLEEREYLYFLNLHNRYVKQLNKYFNNKKCIFDIKDIFYDEEFSFEDIIKIVLLFNEIQDNKENMYNFRNYKSNKEDILDSLSYVISNKGLNDIEFKYNKLLSDPSKLNELQNLVKEINKITKEDYLNKISNLNNINNENFNFIVHSVKTDTWYGEFRDPLVSGSLITNEVKRLYNLGVGFILDPSSMISANSKDTYTSNAMYSNSFSTVGNLPIIYSYDKVINDCKKYMKENPKEKIYNEVVLTKFNPLAIFYYPDEKEFNKQIAINLKKEVEEIYPNLQIIEIGSKITILDNVKKEVGRHI